ncbi:MAG: hypothetical protein ACRDHD_04625 [Candidatus Limnocylindria bacterium]
MTPTAAGYRVLAAMTVSVLLLAGCGTPEPTAVLTAPPPFPGSEGATAWSDAGTPPAHLGPQGDGFASARDLLAAAVEDIRAGRDAQAPDVTAHLLGDDGQGGAIAVVYVVGSLDDSVAGDEAQLSMRPGEDGRWRLLAARMRTHCRRGVSEGLCL